VVVLPPLILGQRATDPEHPEGKWEVLDRCRLLTNAPVDGDSFQVSCRGREYAFRLYFVDAPEVTAEFKERIEDQATFFGIAPRDVPRLGEIAARFTRERLSGREFTVKTRWQNALGRSHLARFYGVVLVDGKDLGESLVTAGLSRVSGVNANLPDGTRSSTMVNKLKRLELDARGRKQGGWDEVRFPRSTSADASSSTNAPMPRAITADTPLDLNAASYDDLQKLPGIGPKLAERMIAHRPYKEVRDLDRVPGIGQKTLERLAPLVRVLPHQP
jgi:competence ComEA-like helix-hairpin-helix protein